MSEWLLMTTLWLSDGTAVTQKRAVLFPTEQSCVDYLREFKSEPMQLPDGIVSITRKCVERQD